MPQGVCYILHYKTERMCLSGNPRPFYSNVSISYSTHPKNKNLKGKGRETKNEKNYSCPGAVLFFLPFSACSHNGRRGSVPGHPFSRFT